MTSILVTGSRDWPSPTLIKCFLDEFTIMIGQREDITLINGGAKGVDVMSADHWRQHGYGNVITVYPDWNLHGRKAGILRNIDMLNMDPTYVIAFIYNHSAGATHTYNEAMRRGMKAYAFRLDTQRGSEL